MNKTVLFMLAATMLLLSGWGVAGYMYRGRRRSLAGRASHFIDKANVSMSDAMEKIRDQASEIMSNASSLLKQMQ